MTDKFHVLVLTCEAKASLPIIESCAAMHLTVIGGSEKKHGCGLYSKHIRKRFQYLSPKFFPNECVDQIEDYLQRNKIAVMFPVGDVMTDLIAKNKDRLLKYTSFVLPDYEIFVRGRNKILTLKAAENSGCPIPRSWYPEDSSLDAELEHINEFPVLIKPAVSAGARGIVLCENKDDVKRMYPDIRAQFGESFLQEFVPQNGMQYKVDAITDSNQNPLAAVVYEKIRYYPASGGSSVLNRTVHRSDIIQSALRVMKELKWVGLCDFDYICDPRDNVVKLMEINPRFPESFRATVVSGVDMTRILYRLALGESPGAQMEYMDDRYCRFLFGDIMWFLTTREKRFHANPSFFRFAGRNMHYQLLRKHDFGPTWGYLRENMAMIWNKKLRRERLR